MSKTKQNTTPAIFQQKFKTIDHKYPTKFSANNLLIPNQKLKSSRFSISARGPTIWNKFCDDGTKKITLRTKVFGGKSFGGKTSAEKLSDKFLNFG